MASSFLFGYGYEDMRNLSKGRGLTTRGYRFAISVKQQQQQHLRHR